MINTNKHLDDLFAAARHEEPILSRENARDLLSESQPMQLPSTFISSKGAIMTSIGLSIAAVTAYVFLSGSPAAHTPNPNPSQPQAANLLVHQTSSNTDVPKKNDPAAATKLVAEKKDESIPTPPEPPTPPSVPVPPVPPMPPTPPVRVTPPMKVTGLTPVTIAPEKLAKMGISKKDDGTVSFSQKNEEEKIFTMSFPKNTWGVIIGDDDVQLNEAPKFAPLIVTDTKGNKRLMQFTSETKGMKMRTMQINSHSDEGGNDNALRIQSKVQIGGKDGDLDGLQVGLDSNELNEIQKEIDVQAENGLNSDNKKTPNQKRVKVFVKTNTSKKDTTINGKRRKMIIINNTVNNTMESDSAFPMLKGFNMDSIIREANKSIRIAHKQIKMINMDSIYKAAARTMKEAEVELKNANEQMNRMNLDSILQSANQSLIEAENVIAKRSNDLNNLIPILVRSATKDHYSKHDDITYDDGLIFWYDNSPDVTKTVQNETTPSPEAVQSIIDAPVANGNVNDAQPSLDVNHPNLSVNGTGVPMTKTLIYPNPARNTTTVRFTLSEPRTLAFSIHDLLGKRVMEAGNLTATSAGSFEKELNVRELSAGVYLLVITTDKGEQSMQRLVIEK